MYGLVIAQSFVSAPFLVVVARSAFRAVDPSLGDVAATLGHGPLARFLRVEVPAAADGLRTGMILMWLRAFGEYGTTVVLAYHPYSLPVYVDNLFSSVPLSEAEAPTVLAFAVAPGDCRQPRPAPGARPASADPGAARPGVDAADAGGLRHRYHGRDVPPAGGAPASSHRLAVVGPSGSGKSVTLRALAGLLGSDAGTVTYGGVDVSHPRPERRRVGYVPQGFGLIPGRTVWQQAIFGVNADPARAAWWLGTLHLDGLLDRLPEQLSGGQRQRVSLARALAGDPQVVLLDEPFSALDAPVRGELRRELRRLQREVNLSTVLVTHDPEEAAMLADEIVVLRDGQVLQSGSCRDVYQRPASAEIGRLLGIDNLFEGVADAAGVLLAGGDRNGGGPGGGVPVGFATGLSVGAHLLWHVPPEALDVRREPSSPARNGSTVELGRVVRHRRRRPRSHRREGGAVGVRRRAPGAHHRYAGPHRRRRLLGRNRSGRRVGLADAGGYRSSRPTQHVWCDRRQRRVAGGPVRMFLRVGGGLSSARARRADKASCIPRSI